ncbi:MAG: T9SS type A sorting domain-containing protein [Candidatus Azobacteroides sp.]|nr:T9SS type A sorting domain-containing protein [Candidatus Azobacteroides sp.]
MKRLFTIFLSSVAGISLWGQQAETLPMTIVGDVYNGGAMKSVGEVHIKARTLDSDTGKVANYGNFAMDEGVIFYTNDSSDGLLMNQKKTDADPAGTVTMTANANVAVRKTFAMSNAWYTMSFPFDVDLKNVKSVDFDHPENNGKLMARGTVFQVQVYDAQQRANNGKPGTATTDATTTTWKTLGGDIDIIPKGTPCRIAVKVTMINPPYSTSNDTVGAISGRFALDFFATNTSNNIANVFSLTDKALSLDCIQAPDRDQTIVDNSEGWNAIGGLNSTNFFMSNNTVEFNGNNVIYYWDGGSAWEPLFLEVGSGTLRPYGVIFLQTGSALAASDGFKYLTSAGLTLASDRSLPIFRSSQSASKNVLELSLTNAKDDSKTSPIYFKFEDGFSPSYKSTEDAVQLYTKDASAPIVWSLAKDSENNNNVLFLNSLPNGENEVPVGVNIPTSGEYVFSMKEFDNEAVNTAVLWDKTTDKYIDLLKYDYNFQAANAVNTEDRFVLFFNNKVITSIDQTNVAEIYAYTNNNMLTVKNIHSGDKIQVLDLTGRIIASGIATDNTFSTTLNQKGVYIVNVSGGKTLKVLNK